MAFMKNVGGLKTKWVDFVRVELINPDRVKAGSMLSRRYIQLSQRSFTSTLSSVDSFLNLYFGSNHRLDTQSRTLPLI